MLPEQLSEISRIPRSDIKTTVVSNDFCNAARIFYGRDSNDFVLLGREMHEPTTARPVDLNKLGTYDPNGRALGEFKLTLPRNIINAEDPRVLTQGEDVLVGFTAVPRHDGVGDQPWYPALVTARMNHEGILEQTSETFVFDGIRGKNITPLTWNQKTGDVTFYVRHDEDETKTHDIAQYAYNTKNKDLELKQTIHIPVRPWNEERIGTVGGPITIDGQTITLLHGQQKVLGKDGRERLHYTVGAAVINEEGEVTKITDEPLVSRSDISDNAELRPDEKIVVYSTDTPNLVTDKEGEHLELAVGFGDMKTAMVKIPKERLLAALKPVNAAAELPLAA